jgi:DNA-binding NarL/FixJ family response regulator
MRVLLVDDHPLILSALKAMIEKLHPGVQVVALASEPAVRQEIANHAEHDLVLLDLQLGDVTGFDLLRDLRSSWPTVPVVVISASDRASDVIQAIDLGAMGFLPKRMSTEALGDALKLVIEGGIYVPTMTVGEVVAPPPMPALAPAPEVPADADPAASNPQNYDHLGITPRQTDVLLLLLQGAPNKDIARRLGLSVETVKDHVQAVLRALGVSSRTQAVLAVGQMTQQRRQQAAAAARTKAE